MEYTVKKIEGGNLIVEFEDSSWAEVPIKKGMSKADIDDAVADFAPKPELDDEQIKELVGSKRTAKKKPKLNVESIDASFANSFAETDAIEPDKEDDWPEVDADKARQELIAEIKQEVLDELNSEV